jgi:ubiquinone/menaquinone biosynthesis C-methylase UbiE
VANLRPLRSNQSYYDAFSERYERGRDQGYHALLDRLELRIVQQVGAGQRVLEVGCGTGLLLQRTATLARFAAGIDLSRGMLGRAHQRGLPVLQSGATQLPFATGSFDVAYSFKVLAHVEAIGQAMAEMTRVVRPGGYVIAEFYNRTSLRYLVKRLKPAQAVAERTTDVEVFTRYDTLASIRSYLPNELHVVRTHGIRIFTPVAKAHDLPLVGPALRWLETRVTDAPWLHRAGGFLVVVAQKVGG